MMKYMEYRNVDAGLLALRLALATVFIAHGVQKFVMWSEMSAFFDSIGLPVPVFAFVALCELLAGIAMLLGVFTAYAGYIIAIIMVVAIAMLKAKLGFFGGWEYDLTLLLVALAVAWMGPGKYRVMMK